MSTRLETERLTIRNFIPSDWQALREIILEKEASEYAPYDYEFPTSVEEVRKIAGWFSSGDAYLAVCLKGSGALIGYVAFNKAENEEAYDLGYCFHPGHQGRGYATEACRCLIAVAFTQAGAEKITSGTAEVNAPSCRLLKRLGFRITGESTVSFRKDVAGNPIEFRGLSFELSKAEWEEQAIFS